MNDSAEHENLKVFYRTMATEDLLIYRRALTLDLEDRTVRRSAERTKFCAERRQLLADVLGERGVEALN